MKNRLSEHDNFGYLAGALALLLFGVALADEIGFRLGQLLIQGAVVMVLVLGVWSVKSQSHWYLTRAGLVVAIVGQFCIAVLVASLVGIRISGAQK